MISYRPIEPDEIDLLDDFLYLAIHQDGPDLLRRSVTQQALRETGTRLRTVRPRESGERLDRRQRRPWIPVSQSVAFFLCRGTS